MAFFKFRKGGDEHPTPAQAPESVEAMRKRARHRLIGAAVLVALGVIGFPMLFDSQPRPIAVDIPIEIPDKNKAKPLGNLPVEAPAVPTGGNVGSEVIVGTASPAALEPKAASSSPEVSTAPTAQKPASTPLVVASAVAKAPPTLQERPVPAPSPSPAAVPAKVDDGSKAQALLDGNGSGAPAPTGEVRYVVQVGAFSDVVKAHEARGKLEKAGLKTYTQVVEPKEGKRIRVRVGPFSSKSEADKVAEKIKKLDLPASILEL